MLNSYVYVNSSIRSLLCVTLFNFCKLIIRKEIVNTTFFVLRLWN